MAQIQKIPEDVILTSNIGNIGIQIDVDYIDVTLKNGSRTLLSERYYGQEQGEVTVYDLASLIEGDMRQRKWHEAWYTLSAYADTGGAVVGDSVTLHVLYCDRTLTEKKDAFLLNNFLTTPIQRRLPPEAEFELFFFLQAGEKYAYTIDATYRTHGQDDLLHEKTVVDNGDVADVSETYSIEVIFSEYERKDMELLSLTVTCGQRSATFYIDPTLTNGSTFFFRNCFNVLDIVSLHGVTKTKTEVERSLASIDGKSLFYNQTVEKTYEVETAPLSSEEANWIDQLFASHDVFVHCSKPWGSHSVLITESTCEVHDGDDKLNTVKFTWRYADNRPRLIFPQTGNTFSSPYNTAFS